MFIRLANRCIWRLLTFCTTSRGCKRWRCCSKLKKFLNLFRRRRRNAFPETGRRIFRRLWAPRDLRLVDLCTTQVLTRDAPPPATPETDWDGTKKNGDLIRKSCSSFYLFVNETKKRCKNVTQKLNSVVFFKDAGVSTGLNARLDWLLLGCSSVGRNDVRRNVFGANGAFRLLSLHVWVSDCGSIVWKLSVTEAIKKNSRTSVKAAVCVCESCPTARSLRCSPDAVGASFTGLCWKEQKHRLFRFLSGVHVTDRLSRSSVSSSDCAIN